MAIWDQYVSYYEIINNINCRDVQIMYLYMICFIIDPYIVYSLFSTMDIFDIVVNRMRRCGGFVVANNN